MSNNGYNFATSLPQDYWQVLFANQVLCAISFVAILGLLIFFLHGLYLESKDITHPHDAMYHRMTRAAIATMIAYLVADVGSILRNNKLFRVYTVNMSPFLCQSSYILTWLGFAVGRFLNNIILFGKFYMTFRDSTFGQQDQHPTRFCWCGFNIGFVIVLVVIWLLFSLSIVFFSFVVVPSPIKNRSGDIWCSPDPSAPNFFIIVTVGLAAFVLEVIIQVILLVLYVRRFKEISSKAGHHHTGKEDTLVRFLRRNFNLAFWTIVPSIFFFGFNTFISPSVGTAIAVPMDTMLNSICIVLIFRFSTYLYQTICTPSENCLVGIKHSGKEFGRVLSSRTSTRSLALSLSHDTRTGSSKSRDSEQAQSQSHDLELTQTSSRPEPLDSVNEEM